MTERRTIRGEIIVVILTLASLLGTSWSTSAAAREYKCFGEVATLVGSSEQDSLIGTPSDDVIVGLGAADTIRGGAGDDLICGNEGGDFLGGGAGNDKLFDGHEVRGGRGDDLVDSGYSGGLYPGPGNDRVVGGEGSNNIFLIGAGNDTVDAGTDSSAIGWDDNLIIKERNSFEPEGDVRVNLTRERSHVLGSTDQIAGVENVIAFCGKCVLIGDENANELNARGESVKIHGRRGDDSIGGFGGDGELRGGGGNDKVIDTSGNDFLAGGKGIDELDYSSETDVTIDLQKNFATGAGDDQLAGFENARGSRYGDDVLRGDDGPNRLYSKGGSDILEGRGGDDYLNGRTGAREDDDGVDTIDGGAGTDECLYPNTGTTGAVNCEL